LANPCPSIARRAAPSPGHPYGTPPSSTTAARLTFAVLPVLELAFADVLALEATLVVVPTLDEAFDV